MVLAVSSLLAACVVIPIRTVSERVVPIGSTEPSAADRARVSNVSIADTGCFGPCPIYSVGLARSGRLTYEGERYVAAIGSRVAQLSPADFDDLVSSLDAWRPHRPGSYRDRIRCEVMVTDGGQYRISWTQPDGVRILEYDRGCRSPEGQALRTTTEGALARLPIAPWTAQRDERP